MDKIGIIFDLNGTMLFDGRYHLEAWKTFIEELTMQEITDLDVEKYITGHGAKDILEHFTGYELLPDMITQFTDEKERVYRSLLMKDRPPLAEGLESFLNFLVLSRIPVNIATTANLENMNYYFEEYSLGRWFQWEKVVIASGNIPLKPHPDMYLAAIDKIGMKAENIAVFEDSEIGVTAAWNAGVRHIIAVTGDSGADELKNKPGVIACIKDYTELNDNLDVFE